MKGAGTTQAGIQGGLLCGNDLHPPFKTRTCLGFADVVVPHIYDHRVVVADICHHISCDPNKHLPLSATGTSPHTIQRLHSYPAPHLPESAI